MQPSFSVSIPLPENIRRSIQTLFCYGLPSTDWVEEECFHLQLFCFKTNKESILQEVSESLEELYFPAFEIRFSGLGHQYRKNGSGALWMTAEPSEPLEKLSREIAKRVNPLLGKGKMRASETRAPLAFFSDLSPARLASFLESRSPVELPPFIAGSFSLLEERQSAKKIFYKEVQHYPFL